MHPIAILTISFSVLGNALPQSSPKESSAPSTRPSADGPDLTGLASFLKNPSIPKLLSSFGITGVEPLWKVPNIQKYAPAYLDFRNISNVPFVVPMPYGPAPTGCSPYELIIG